MPNPSLPELREKPRRPVNSDVGHRSSRSKMLTFEQLTYFLTGIRGEANQRGTRNRIWVGLLVNALLLLSILAFAGAAAGNAGATNTFWSYFVPAAALAFIAILLGSITFFTRGHWQLAQYLAWSPLLLFVALQIIQLGSLFMT